MSEREPILRLIKTLEHRLAQIPALGTPSADASSVLEEARLMLLFEKHGRWRGDGEVEPAARSRLRSTRYWHDRQRQVLQTIDQTLMEMLEAEKMPEMGSPLETAMVQLLERIPLRCRGPLLERYGLGEAEGVKLPSPSSAGKRRTRNCLLALSRAVLEEDLPRPVIEPPKNGV